MFATADEVADDHEKVAKRMHKVIRLAEEHDDPVTADLVTARSAFHEQAAWMLRATAKQGGTGGPAVPPPAPPLRPRAFRSTKRTSPG